MLIPDTEIAFAPTLDIKNLNSKMRDGGWRKVFPEQKVTLRLAARL